MSRSGRFPGRRSLGSRTRRCRVDGRAPPDNPPYHVAGWLHEVSPEVRERIWWNGLDQMATVHRLEPLEFLPPRTAKEQLVMDREYAAWVLGDREYPIVSETMDELERTMPAVEGPAAQCWATRAKRTKFSMLPCARRLSVRCVGNCRANPSGFFGTRDGGAWK